MATKRININISEDLLEELDKYASRLHLTRSSTISFIVSQHLETVAGLDIAKQLKESGVDFGLLVREVAKKTSGSIT